MILLKQDLLCSMRVSGRAAYLRNIMKYIMMGTSSNFGNMFSWRAPRCSCHSCRCCRRRYCSTNIPMTFLKSRSAGQVDDEEIIVRACST